MEDLKVMMSLEQNEVFLNWTALDAKILSNFKLSYKLFYTLMGTCAVSKCQTDMCRVQKKIKSKSNSIAFNQKLFAFSNYTWLLELTYSNDGSVVENYNISVDVQTSQSGECTINATHCYIIYFLLCNFCRFQCSSKSYCPV